MSRVLVTSAQERFALAACRSLHDAGYAVSAVADQTPAAAHWSRCCDARYVLPDAKEDADAFVDGLVEIVEREPHDVLLPATDAAVLAVSQRRGRLEPHVRLGLPPHEVVDAATDKIALVEAGRDAGLPSPETIVCHTHEDGLRAARAIGLPVVIKPRRTAFELDGAIHQRGSAKVGDESELADVVDRFGSPYLIQDVVAGQVYSAAGVLTDGGMIGFATARYLRTWPSEAGNVAFAETVEPPSGLAQSVERLLRAIGWTGIFELELIRSGDGGFASIDLNPRLYGSLALASGAGAPLAVVFCDWLLGRADGAVVARPGVRYRWEDADLRHALSDVRAGDLRGAAAVLRPRRGVVHAHFRASDPGPLLARAAFLVRDRRSARGGAPARRKEVFSTLRYTRRARWVERVDMPPEGLSTAAHVRAVVAAARSHRALILDGSGRADQLAAIAVARLRRRPRVAIADATWKLGPSPLDRLASRAAIRALDGPHVVYGVLSTHEVESFARTWGVDRERVRFLPWHHTLTDEELAIPTRDDGGVFAGGDSVRDYRPLVDAAASLGSTPVTIASRTLTAASFPGLPDNVTIGELDHRTYMERTAAAGVVVVALEERPDRSAGQGTYLNAMALGKVVVVPDVAGARDYVRDGETGVIVPPGDAAALAAAIRELLDSPDERRRIGAAARDDVLERFGPERYVDNLLVLAG